MKVLFESIFHRAVCFSNHISSSHYTRYLSCPGEREERHHFPQRLLVLHIWVACRHLSIEHDATSTQHIDIKSAGCPRLSHGNHPNKTNTNHPVTEFHGRQNKKQWSKFMSCVHFSRQVANNKQSNTIT